MREPGDRLCERLGVWPVRITAAGIHGWSLWFDGDPDLLLVRGGVIPLFPSPDALVAALASEPEAYLPPAVTQLDPASLEGILAAKAATFDLDAASAWFARPDREADQSSCAQALNAINLAADIGASVNDADLAALYGSEALTPAHDALTFGQTVLGDGGPYRDDPAAMVAAITPEAADAAVRLLALATAHIEIA